VSGSEKIQVIQERLRLELSQARTALDMASAKHWEVERHCRARGTISDGVMTLRETQELHTLAARRYRMALRRFSDFVAEGKAS
jgi:hypothetical protein